MVYNCTLYLRLDSLTRRWESIIFREVSCSAKAWALVRLRCSNKLRWLMDKDVGGE